MARFNPVTEADTPAAPAANPATATGTTPAPARSKPAKSGRKPKVLRSGGVVERIHALPERALGCLAEEIGRSDLTTPRLEALRQEFAAYAEAHPEFTDWRKAWSAYKSTVEVPVSNIIAAPTPTVAERWVAAEQAEQKLAERKRAAANVLAVPEADWKRGESVAVPIALRPAPTTPHLTIKRWGLPSWRRV